MVRISVHGEKDGAFKVARKASSLGRWIGFARDPKRFDWPDVSLALLTASRLVDAARPPSDVSWVINCDKVFGREGSERVRGRLIEDVCIGLCSLPKLQVRTCRK